MKLLILKGIVIMTVVLWMTLSSLPADAETESDAFVTISEEYTDNILLDRQRIDEYITRVVPTVTILHKNRMFKLNGRYALDYKYYANYARDNYRERLGLGKEDIDHVVDASLDGEPVNNTLFVKASESYQKVSLDAKRNFTEESYFLNQSDRNMFEVNPYLLLSPLNAFEVKAGYIYRTLDYRAQGANDSETQSLYVGLERQASDRVTYGAGYRHSTEDNEINDFREYEGFLTFRYESGENKYLFIQVGNSHFHFEDGEKTDSMTWGATVRYDSEPYGIMLQSEKRPVPNPSGTPLQEDMYRLEITAKMMKASHAYGAAYYEYRDLATGDHTTDRYNAFGAVKYEIASGTSMDLDARYDIYRDKVVQSDTDVYFISAGVCQEITGKTEISFMYRYLDSSSNETPEDNYYSNRFILSLAVQIW